jgi:type III pantothenate kinase
MTAPNALLFDLGNTRIKAALAVGGGIQDLAAWPFTAADAWEQVEDWVAARAPGVRRACLACVTRPGRRNQLRGLLRRRELLVHEVGPPCSDALLRLAYAQPQRMGVDRWLALRALRCRLEGGFVLVGCGSALTVDTVSTDGRHLGGVIAPSPERALEALRRRARHLPEAAGPISAFAIDTASAMRSGAVLSAQGLIEHVLRAAEIALQQPLSLVLSGGGAAALMPGLQARALLHEQAVLEGLADWALALPPPGSG